MNWDKTCEIENTILAYLAGFIDGEGCIGLIKTRGYGKRAENTTPYYLVNISATNCIKAPLELLMECFGGGVYMHHRPSAKDKDCWRWTIRAKKAVMAIKDLYPYLRVKKPQAEQCLKFAATINNNSLCRTIKKGRLAGTRVKSSVMQKRELIAEQLSILNKQGK